MFYDRVKLTTANWGSTKRLVTTTSKWLYPSKVSVEWTGDISTARKPLVFTVVVGTTPTTNEVEFTAPNEFTFGTGANSATTTYTSVNIYGCPRGSGSTVS